MIMTSYFGRYRGTNGICIARQPPKGYTGKVYPSLFPNQEDLYTYKYKNGSWEEFEKAYILNVLSKLNPKSVYNDLNGYVLLCYEKEGDFCHRHIVAKWLESKLEIYVPEFAENFCENHGDIAINGRHCKINGLICPYFKNNCHECLNHKNPITYKQLNLLDLI